MEQKQHLYYFDYLRIFAAFCVIFMHTAADPLRAEFNGSWDALNLLTSLSFTAVPLFFMMSGYLLMAGERTMNISILIKKRLPKLLLPLATWSLIYIIWELFQNGSLYPRTIVVKLLQSFQAPAAVHLWFLYTLIALYMISPFLYGAIHSLNRKGHSYLLVLLGGLNLQAMLLALLPSHWAQLLNWDIFSKLQLFGGHLCSFLLGYYLGSMKRHIPNHILLIIAGLLLGMISIGTRILSFKNGVYTTTFQQQHMGYEVLLAACVFLLCKQNLDRIPKKHLYLPKAELLLSVYLLHNLLLSILLSKGIVAQGFFDTILIAIGIYIFSYYIVKTLASIKILSYLFTGISYGNACKSCNWIATLHRLQMKHK